VTKIQILLRKECRSGAGVEKVKEAAESLGMKPTSSGTATLSAEMEPGVFASVFGEMAQALASRPPGQNDFGSPGGEVSGPLEVPESLREWVESITVAPPYTRF
jgi:hypothetical protein